MLRLHLAQPEPVVNTPDIQAALDIWRKINANPNTWASFKAIQFKYERVAYVTWGNILGNGFKERAIQTITFRLDSKGAVNVTKHTHS